MIGSLNDHFHELKHGWHEFEDRARFQLFFHDRIFVLFDLAVLILASLLQIVDPGEAIFVVAVPVDGADRQFCLKRHFHFRLAFYVLHDSSRRYYLKGLKKELF